MITYSKYNLANNIDGDIELNENLLKDEWKDLHRQLLRHELKHNNTNIKQDLIADFGESKVSNKELLKFIIKNPRSLTQFLPFYYSKKYGFRYDLSYLITYLILIISVSLVIYFLNYTII